MPSLAEVEREASLCTRCTLAGGRTQVVFGVGDPEADLMFVGEGPGAQEDLQGEPFVGRSGQLLDRLVFEEMGLTRDRFYIANAVKCLRHNAMVQLGDRSWERIGHLVRSKYNGTVMSVNDKGHLVPGRVSGWHTSPLGGRRLFDMTSRSGKWAGTWQVGVQLTGDHPVLTETGYVPVEELEPGARVATGQGLSAVASPGPPEVIYDEVIYDEVILREVTDDVRSDTTFFCIDVDETHNFVTAGGVVHNCRPPGNRDPQPAEIATCRPWLESQIELIDPRVVVTLGNFATKLLLDTTEGITRMRGRAYPFRNGMVVPTFHPAAALRSGAVTVANMRADLVRAKQLLEGAPRSGGPSE
ncbi:MAG: uracil-DNA glycosylase family protein [Acidimicrobiales bacterium]